MSPLFFSQSSLFGISFDTCVSIIFAGTPTCSAKGGHWQHLISTGRRHTAKATLDVLRPIFEDRIISHRADVVWPPRSYDWTPLAYCLWGAVKDKCYADKPETIDALKDNIRETIGEMQLNTIDNVLKNWTDRVGYCMASRGSHLNEIIFHY